MTFNLWTFLFEVLNFLVLVFVLHRLLYRPLREAIEQRREANTRAQAEAEQARQQAAELEKRISTQLAELDQQRHELVREAREQAQAERRGLLAETEREVERRRHEARQALEREHEDAWQALRTELTTQALTLAGRLLSEAADEMLQQQFVRRLVESLGQLAEEERERLRADGQNGDGVLVETARELGAPEHQQVAAAVAALLNREATLTVQTRPELLAGVRLRVGGRVWDASLAGQLEAAERVCQETPGHD
jgi:F-type H+-transporting ATPase subunit b